MAITPTGSTLALQRETLQKLTPTTVAAPTESAPKADAVRPPVVIISQVGCVVDKQA